MNNLDSEQQTLLLREENALLKQKIKDLKTAGINFSKSASCGCRYSRYNEDFVTYCKSCIRASEEFRQLFFEKD